MVTTEPTCTEAGIKTRECDCGVTERAEVPAAGHNWDAGRITREPTSEANGVKTYTCLVCKATKTEPVKYSGSLEVTMIKKAALTRIKTRVPILKKNMKKIQNKLLL